MFRYHNRTWLLVAGLLAAAILFYFANHPAYRGYFSDDDLATMRWAPIVGLGDYSVSLLSPKFSELNFRPVGCLYYRFLDRTFGLHYMPYVAVLQVLHTVNVVLLFFLLEWLGFPRIAAGAGALFYAFNAAVMEAYWKPMFVFDLLCATLSLGALLLYIRGRWLLALIPFWLAYKSKEIAVLLPMALLVYELLLGQRRWKRLIPYFLISLSFGLQALWHNGSIPQEHTYALHFTPDTLLNAARFYSSAILFLPDLWVALLVLPLLVRDRRLTFGVVLTVSTFLPLLFLRPEHWLGVYWYVPMIGLVIALAAIAARTPRWAIALFFLLWLPLYFVLLRDKRRAILAEGDRTRSFLAALRNYAHQIPPVRAVVFDKAPEHIQNFGVDGAVGQVFGPSVEAAWSGDPRAKEAMAKVPMALIKFDPVTYAVKGMLRSHDGLQSYVRFQENVPESQFGAGWYDKGSALRWAAPRSESIFYRPAGATEFEVMAFLPREIIEPGGPSQVTVFEDDQSLGTVTLSESHLQPLRWKLTGGGTGDKRITIVSKPVRHGGPEDPRDFGIVVAAIGYVPAS